MYVFRPQQIPLSTGCSCGKMSFRNSRRTTKSRMRTPRRLVARRAHRLKDVQSSPSSCGQSAPTPGDKKRELVLDRLRMRLVERRANELVATLERRHGDQWIQHVLQGGFHADEAMRRCCEAFGLRPELERWVLRLVLRKAQQGTKASFSSMASPSTSEDEALLFHRCEEISNGGGRSDSEDEDTSEAARPSKLWRASWRLRVLNVVQKLAPPQVLSKDLDEEEQLSDRLREAMENAERYAQEALQEVPEVESCSEPKVESRISFTDSEICFFAFDEDGDTDEEYTRQLQTKGFDGPSGHKARKASYCWCDEDSDESDEEDWKDQCDEMSELMGQQRQMVLWSGSW